MSNGLIAKHIIGREDEGRLDIYWDRKVNRGIVGIFIGPHWCENAAVGLMKEVREQVKAKTFIFFELWFNRHRPHLVDVSSVNGQDVSDYLERIGIENRYYAYQVLRSWEKREAYGRINFCLCAAVSRLVGGINEVVDTTVDQKNRLTPFWKIDLFKAQRVPQKARYMKGMLVELQPVERAEYEKLLVPAVNPSWFIAVDSRFADILSGGDEVTVWMDRSGNAHISTGEVIRVAAEMAFKDASHSALKEMFSPEEISSIVSMGGLIFWNMYWYGGRQFKYVDLPEGPSELSEVH